jgi:hypothetical protein
MTTLLIGRTTTGVAWCAVRLKHGGPSTLNKGTPTTAIELTQSLEAFDTRIFGNLSVSGAQQDRTLWKAYLDDFEPTQVVVAAEILTNLAGVSHKAYRARRSGKAASFLPIQGSLRETARFVRYRFSPTSDCRRQSRCVKRRRL